MVKPVKRLVELGFKVVATGGTADHLRRHGIEAQRVNKVLEGRPHIVDLMKDGKVQLVFNTVDGSAALTDSFTLRRTALMHKIAYYTTVAGAKASVEGIAALSDGALDVAPLQSYFKTHFLASRAQIGAMQPASTGPGWALTPHDSLRTIRQWKGFR